MDRGLLRTRLEHRIQYESAVHTVTVLFSLLAPASAQLSDSNRMDGGWEYIPRLWVTSIVYVGMECRYIHRHLEFSSPTYRVQPNGLFSAEL